MTSSQAHGGIIAAFPLFKDKPLWVKVVSYMYGEENWREKLNVPLPANQVAGNDHDTRTDHDTSNEEDPLTVIDPLNPRTIQEYLAGCIPAEDNDFERIALTFLKKYVFGDGNDDADDSNGGNSGAEPGFGPDMDAKGAVVGSAEEAKRIVSALREH